MGINRLIYWVIRRILFIFVKTRVTPTDLSSLEIDHNKPILYILKNKSLSDMLILDQECQAMGLPRPTAGFKHYGLSEGNASLYIAKPLSRFNRKPSRQFFPQKLMQAVSALDEAEDGDIQMIPVSIFWGRAPNKENSAFKLLLSDSWSVPGVFRKFLIILIQGRATMVHFSSPLSMREAIESSQTLEHTARKLSRQLRVHFQRIRETLIGPDLSHRRTLVNRVLRKRPVIKAIEKEAFASKTKSRRKAKRKALRTARRYGDEIAADYSHATIQFYNVLLTWLWNKLYDGVVVSGIERLQKVATDNVVIYVPCHRSHIDYLLASYVLFHNGFVPPHIASGLNLNLPVVGSLLRRGGAFFLRRSFKGNQLYTTVFNEYVNEVFDRGFSMEYFIEGGRSRTGRLLKPRPGMISMTVRSFLRTQRRRFVFVPIYVGYEKVLEGRSYVGELGGKAKKKESLWGLLMALPKISNTFGRVFVNFGEPIHLNQILEQNQPHWQQQNYHDDDPPTWVRELIPGLGRQIITHINNAAVVNPVNLLSLVLLATPKNAMDETQLIKQLDAYLALLRQAPYSDTMELPHQSGEEIVAYAEKLQMLERRKHSLGDIMLFNEANAILLSYARNNILHLFALPSFLSRLLINNRKMSTDEILHMFSQVYPLLQAELFLRFSMTELPDYIHQTLNFLTDIGWIIKRGNDYWSPDPTSEAAISLNVLANAIRQSLERYYITTDILIRAGSGELSRAQLEDICCLMGQRIALLNQFAAPEFSDKKLFAGFIDTMINNGVIWLDEDNKLAFADRLKKSETESHLILGADIREAIQQVAQLDINILNSETTDTKKTTKSGKKTSQAA